MSYPILALAAFIAPAGLGVLAAVVGARQVRRLRRLTGDNSVLTKVLSGSFRDEPPSEAPGPKLAA
jgi:hypothetical protein